MKIQMRFLLAALWATLSGTALGQGTFRNLDFESATVPVSQPPSPNPSVPNVDIAAALPGWSVVIGTNQVGAVLYNSQTLDTSAVALFRNNYTNLSVIDGTFSVFFLAGRTGVPGGTLILTDTTLSQTGLIPVAAQSLQFKARQVVFPTTSIAVSLDDQALSTVPLQVTPQYTLFGVDVTAFQGQTRELRFTIFSSGVGRGFVLDSISFSNQPIPEPGTIGLFSLGALLLCSQLRTRRNR